MQMSSMPSPQISFRTTSRHLSSWRPSRDTTAVQTGALESQSILSDDIEALSRQTKTMSSIFRALVAEWSGVDTSQMDELSLAGKQLVECNRLYNDLLWNTIRVATQAKAVALDEFNAIASKADQHSPKDIIDALNFLVSTFPLVTTENKHADDLRDALSNTLTALGQRIRESESSSAAVLAEVEAMVDKRLAELSKSRQELCKAYPVALQAMGFGENSPKLLVFLAIAPFALSRLMMKSEAHKSSFDKIKKAQKKVTEDEKALDKAMSRLSAIPHRRESDQDKQVVRQKVLIRLKALQSMFEELRPKLLALGKVYDIVKADIVTHVASLTDFRDNDHGSREAIAALTQSGPLLSSLGIVISTFWVPEYSGLQDSAPQYAEMLTKEPKEPAPSSTVPCDEPQDRQSPQSSVGPDTIDRFHPKRNFFHPSRRGFSQEFSGRVATMASSIEARGKLATEWVVRCMVRPVQETTGNPDSVSESCAQGADPLAPGIRDTQSSSIMTQNPSQEGGQLSAEESPFPDWTYASTSLLGTTAPVESEERQVSDPITDTTKNHGPNATHGHDTELINLQSPVDKMNTAWHTLILQDISSDNFTRGTCDDSILAAIKSCVLQLNSVLAEMWTQEEKLLVAAFNDVYALQKSSTISTNPGDHSTFSVDMLQPALSPEHGPLTNSAESSSQEAPGANTLPPMTDLTRETSRETPIEVSEPPEVANKNKDEGIENGVKIEAKDGMEF